MAARRLQHRDAERSIYSEVQRSRCRRRRVRIARFRTNGRVVQLAYCKGHMRTGPRTGPIRLTLDSHNKFSDPDEADAAIVRCAAGKTASSSTSGVSFESSRLEDLGDAFVHRVGCFRIVSGLSESGCEDRKD
ncbi:hypothetical protein Trydic_g78 [Trypoxylus dichotomus]